MKASSLEDLRNKLVRTNYAVVQYHLIYHQEDMVQTEANKLFKEIAKSVIAAVNDLGELRKKSKFKNVEKEVKKAEKKVAKKPAKRRK